MKDGLPETPSQADWLCKVLPADGGRVGVDPFLLQVQWSTVSVGVDPLILLVQWGMIRVDVDLMGPLNLCLVEA